MYPLRDVVADAWKELGVERTTSERGSMTELLELKRNLCVNGDHKPSYQTHPAQEVTLLTNMGADRVILTTAVYSGPPERSFSALAHIALRNYSCSDNHVLRDPAEVGRNLFDHFAMYIAFKLHNHHRTSLSELLVGPPYLSS